jgi:ubiquinone/menaquinone biosynthesis C-methylase UbiE
MAVKESNAYILGTDTEELNRLGTQHQVWASEAQQGWLKAGFTRGNTLLDLGCGPGFCTRELAYIAGDEGKVIGIDKSEHYIKFLNEMSSSHGLNIDARGTDFNDMILEDNSLDGLYCRWALAWISNPKEILQKVLAALKPGGKMVLHEYYDWTTHQIEPQLEHLTYAIKRCYNSFKEQEGDIDIGRHLPKMLEDIGMKITGTRPMAKMARPSNATWLWPKSFYNIYFPKLVELGYLSQKECDLALKDHQTLEDDSSSTLVCPLLIEVIAEKI